MQVLCAIKIGEKAGLADEDAGAPGTQGKGVAFDGKAAFRYLVAAAVISDIIKDIQDFF